MTTCNHESCGCEEKIWFPTDNSFSDITLHPWCVHCGLIKNISEDKAHNIGYWLNVLARIKDNFSLKKVQIRLIAKELEKNQYFNDLYGTTASSQKKLFIKTVSKITNISTNLIDTLVY